MAKAKKSPAKKKQVAKKSTKKVGRPSKHSLALITAEEALASAEALRQQLDVKGDMVDPHLNVPLNKNELMLLGLALRMYRLDLAEGKVDIPKLALEIMKGECTTLEAKVLSNEVSWNSLYGNGDDTTHIELV